MRRKPKSHDHGKRKLDNRWKGTAHQRGYTGRWQKASKGFLRKHPLCAVHHMLDPMQPVLATLVDHIRPHRGDKRLFWTRPNWQPLCEGCHNAKTAREQLGWAIDWVAGEHWVVGGERPQECVSAALFVDGWSESYKHARTLGANWWPLKGCDLATRVELLEQVLQEHKPTNSEI